MIPKDKIDKAKKILEINQKIKSFGTAFIAKKIDDVEEEIGSLTKIVTSRTTVTAPATTDGNIFSGTYTPTLTGVTNVTSSTAYVCQYMRVGNVVTVSGKIEVTPTINNTQTTIGISLPIASNFANSNELGGTSHTVANTVAGHGAAIYADATNDRAEMDYFETHGASDTFAFSFTYKII